VGGARCGVPGRRSAAARRDGAWTSPTPRIVGIDPWKPSIEIARRNVADAGLGDRIELREQGVESLEDEGAFDLAWLPIGFIPARVLGAAYERTRRALRPGGWMLVTVINPDLGPRYATMLRLRTTLFGNAELAPAHVEGMLRAAGLTDAHTLPSPPGAFPGLVAARRSPA
jgi:SAM-dependent methyltransferase